MKVKSENNGDQLLERRTHEPEMRISSSLFFQKERNNQRKKKKLCSARLGNLKGKGEFPLNWVSVNKDFKQGITVDGVGTAKQPLRQRLRMLLCFLIIYSLIAWYLL